MAHIFLSRLFLQCFSAPVIRYLEEAKKKLTPPAVVPQAARPQTVRCLDVKWPGEVEFEAARMVISGEDAQMLNTLVSQLESVFKIKPRDATAKAVLEDEDVRSEWIATSWEGVKRLVKYLVSAERGARTNFSVELHANFKMGKDLAATFEKVFKTLKVEVYGRKC